VEDTDCPTADGTCGRRPIYRATGCQSPLMLPVTVHPCCGMQTASMSVVRPAIRPPLLLPGTPTTPPAAWTPAVFRPGGLHGGRLKLSHLDARGCHCSCRFRALRSMPPHPLQPRYPPGDRPSDHPSCYQPPAVFCPDDPHGGLVQLSQRATRGRHCSCGFNALLPRACTSSRWKPARTNVLPSNGPRSPPPCL